MSYEEVREREKKNENKVGKFFEITEDLKIKNCIMKKGDIIKITGYGSGMACHFWEFANQRLPKYTFRAGCWVLESKIVEKK